MNRITFTSSLAATLAARSIAFGGEHSVDAIAGSIEGTVAVFAQRLSERSPSVAINISKSFPAASIIKLVILIAVYRAIDTNVLRLDDMVAFRSGDVVGGSDSFGSARIGQTASVRSLARAMIAQSDNSASNALVGHFGFAALNTVAADLGLRNTHLRRLFMHSARFGQNVTTAADIGDLLLGIERGARGEHQPYASTKSCRAMVVTMLGQEDREKIVRGLPHGTPVANKTGELPLVRHDAAIVDPFGGHPYVLVVLEKALRDQGNGVVGINRISRAVYNRYRQSSLDE